MTSFSLDLQAPREPLFWYLADPRNRKEWQSSILSLEMQDTGTAREGMRWQEVARGFGRFEMSITTLKPHVTWAEHGSSPRGEIDLQLTFDPGHSSDVTRLTVEVSLQLKGILGTLSPAARLLLQPLMSSDLRRAAATVRKNSS